MSIFPSSLFKFLMELVERMYVYNKGLFSVMISFILMIWIKQQYCEEKLDADWA